MNIPSPEALFRNILYGNNYFKNNFGKKSVDIFLPDCFGFGYALPSIAHHAGLKGFTTQKLVWSSAYGIPFDIGKWYGPDGKFIYASLDAQGYTNAFVSARNSYGARYKLCENLRKYDLPFTYKFHGVGDRGGAPLESSVRAVCKDIRKNHKSKIDVLSAPADQIFRDIDTLLTEKQKYSLPSWRGELVSPTTAWAYTSRAIGKRRNAEASSCRRRGAFLRSRHEPLGREYPAVKLEGLERLIAPFPRRYYRHSLNVCYQRNWNDYILSLNELSAEYEGAVKLLPPY